MAEYCRAYGHELHDVHRWLPSEILRDIGIVEPDERRSLAVVEDLGARLASVLGSTGVETTKNYHSTTPFLYLLKPFALPRFAPAPARPPPPLPAASAAPPAKRRGGGTGVFLPRTEASYDRTIRGSRVTAGPPGDDAEACISAYEAAASLPTSWQAAAMPVKACSGARAGRWKRPR